MPPSEGNDRPLTSQLAKMEDRPSMNGAGAVNRRLLAIVGWLVVLLVWSHGLVHLGGLKHLRPVRWPTDLYTLGRINPGPVDLLILGSSRMTFGVAPTAIDPCVSERVGRTTSSWSWSRANASLWSQWLVGREALQHTRPGVVLIEVAPEMASRNHYEQAWNAKNEAEVQDIPDCFSGAQGLEEVEACLYPLVRPLDNLSRLDVRSPQDAPHLRWMALYARGGQFCFGTAECRAHNARFAPRLETRWKRREEKVLPLIASERFADYEIGPPQTTGIDRLVRAAREQGAQPVLVRMPVHSAYSERIPADAERQFGDYLEVLVAREGLPLLDLSQQWSEERSLYADPDHLNEQGALRLSAEVCRVVAPLLRG
jgi:hypothetical protein